jgi:hypothetical protein
MGAIPVFWVFGFATIGFAAASAYAGFERGSKAATVHVAIAAAAAVLLVCRKFYREPFDVFLLGLIACNLATIHANNIGRTDSDDH